MLEIDHLEKVSQTHHARLVLACFIILFALRSGGCSFFGGCILV
jgi:hypothetical protein